MPIKPNAFQGAYERQYFRQSHYAHWFPCSVDESRRLAAQANDQDLLTAYLDALEQTLQRAVVLKPTEDSEVVLAMKAELDRLLTLSYLVPSDQRETQRLLDQLIHTMMQSIRHGAGDDAQAVRELTEESEARKQHIALLSTPLVADLLSDHPIIPPQSLLPTLLNAQKDALAAAVQLFDRAQTDELIDQAQALIGSLESEGQKCPELVYQNLAFIKGYRVFLDQAT